MAPSPMRETSSPPSEMCFMGCGSVFALIGWATDALSRRLVDIAHVLFRHAAAVHGKLGERRLELAQLCLRQLNIECSEVLLQFIYVACTRYRNDPRLLRQAAGQCALRRGCSLCCRPMLVLV